MTLMKQNIMMCSVESPEAFLGRCKKRATELKGNGSKKGKKCRIADNVFGADWSTTRHRDQEESQANPFFFILVHH